jgi:hypothetical protein
MARRLDGGDSDGIGLANAIALRGQPSLHRRYLAIRKQRHDLSPSRSQTIVP